MLRSIKLTNFLSYGGDSDAIDLKSLNVIIGPNGVGKSNLLDALELLRFAPGDLIAPTRSGGGVHDWLWKGIIPPMPASLDVVINYSQDMHGALRYVLSFTALSQRFKLLDERIERIKPDHDGFSSPYFFYKFEDDHGVLNIKDGPRRLQVEDIETNQSIISQRKDPDQYPEITFLGNMLTKIRIYREWGFGRFTVPRIAQKVDLPDDFMEPDCSNLGLVLNRLQEHHEIKKRIIKELGVLYEGIEDYFVKIDSGTVQVFFQERVNNRIVPMPASRLSDGTLRYLCLLAILCHPNPPPLICLEEPELGLHPDVLPRLVQLLKDASELTQLIVITHSDILVDELTDQPDAVLVADKGDAGTTLTRLDKEKLKPWLEKYRLGQLWTRGDIRGTRW